jgi:hypothetical protein
MSNQKPEESMVYRVGIVRQDMGFDPLYILEDMDKLKALAKLKELINEWQDSVDKKRPFHLTEQLRSFLPSLIIEIRIDQISYTDYQRINTPYERQMREQGTSSFMHNTFKG